jgi:hypothetical protein
LRGDAAFAGPKRLRLLEQADFRYAIPKVFYSNWRYRAGSWDCARRVVVKIAWHAGE